MYGLIMKSDKQLIAKLEADVRRMRRYIKTLEFQRPLGWITAESVMRLSQGGNGSRGTVPIHPTYSNTATIPLYRMPREREAGRK